MSNADALSHASEMINVGVDIIDIGGESSRPGSAPISANEELSRVIPVIQGIKNKYPSSIISVDTTKYE
ncbi:MAG: dihydropteroate synthase [Ignavibacteriales bacterium]|nr:dihydropteroate synthase [Ignavibacteriales bacterium]